MYYILPSMLWHWSSGGGLDSIQSVVLQNIWEETSFKTFYPKNVWRREREKNRWKNFGGPPRRRREKRQILNLFLSFSKTKWMTKCWLWKWLEVKEIHNFSRLRQSCSWPIPFPITTVLKTTIRLFKVALFIHIF